MTQPEPNLARVALDESFAKALPILASVVRKTYMPILSNVRLTHDGATLTATTTDLEHAISYSAPCDGAAFSTTVSAKALADAVGRAKSAYIAVEGAVLPVSVTADGRTTVLPALPADEFPKVGPSGKPTVATFALPLWDLASTFGAAAAHASDEEARGAVMMGVLLEAKDGTLHTVGTDGFSMAIANTCADVTGEAKNVIVPGYVGKVLAKLAALTKKTTPDVRVTVTQHDASFAVDGWTVTVRLVDGQYPNYGAVLPKAYDRELRVKSSDLLGAAKAAAKLGSGQRLSTMLLTIGAESIAASASTDEGGSFSAEIACETVKGASEPLTIRFNAAYLARCLATAGGEYVRCAFIEPLKPAQFTAWDDGGAEVILMPLRA